MSVHVPFEFFLRICTCSRCIGDIFCDVGIAVKRPEIIQIFEDLVTKDESFSFEDKGHSLHLLTQRQLARLLHCHGATIHQLKVTSVSFYEGSIICLKYSYTDHFALPFELQFAFLQVFEIHLRCIACIFANQHFARAGF